MKLKGYICGVLAAVTIVVAGGNLHGPMMRLKKMFPSLRKGKK